MIPTHLLQTGNDIDRSVYEQILQFIRLRVTETYAFPPEIVRVDDITIATLGNFSASVGKPKSKKTFNITAIVAAALSGKNVLRYNAHLPEGKHKVLYVDTEQSKCHCHKVLERILRLAGLPTDRETDNLEFFMLREYSPKQRRQIINHALASDPGIGFVVIDGIRDLLYDINSPSESVDLINDLMRCCKSIWTASAMSLSTVSRMWRALIPGRSFWTASVQDGRQRSIELNFLIGIIRHIPQTTRQILSLV